MAAERTFSIIKPDATARSLTGEINAIIENAGLKIVAQKRIKLSQAQAEGFYGVHKERPFFKDLVKFMTSGPVVVQVLEGENAVAKYPSNSRPVRVKAEFCGCSIAAYRSVNCFGKNFMYVRRSGS